MLIVLAAVAASSTSCVRTGHVGVVTLFGRVTGRSMPEGIHLVNPVARVHELDIKTREIKERASVPSKEGLMMGLEASVLYHLTRTGRRGLSNRADYADVLLVPNFRSAMRAVTAANTASSLYSDSREGMARQILSDLQAQVQPRGIVIENVLLRDLQLPETLKHAIEAKQQAQQEAQQRPCPARAAGVGTQARRGAGHRDFQNIVRWASATSCRWKGIEATIGWAQLECGWSSSATRGQGCRDILGRQ
jgi:regulator of protease activity HflC (stomatin/prohibitin superfamily)